VPDPSPVPDVQVPGSAAAVGRRLLTAEMLSIGTELTVGETLDTNAGELARSLVSLGVRATRVTALPDHLETVADAFREALARSDLVITTGGLGPTPDDLTREALALVCGETPTVDPDLLAWLHGLWDRRGMPFPDMNVKQAWVIPSAVALANPHGTAPGWFVVRPDGRVVVTLPGPPREMRPMWQDEALPRLRERGLGRDLVVRTLRLTGIGESQVADRLGEAILRATNPIVATYARADAVDIRISAVDGDDGASATTLVDEAERAVLDAVGEFVWAHGSTSWPEALDEALGSQGWILATTETGTAGSLVALLGELRALRMAHVEGAAAAGPDQPDDDADGSTPGDELVALAVATRERAGADVGLAVRARPRKGDTAVSIAIAFPTRTHVERRIVFLTGPQGRSRTALAAAAVLLEQLRRD
jgi:nicotinamide-nucleotide amidase